MRNIKVDTSRVKLAQLRYFNLERKASEIPEDKAYAVLVEVNGTYINVLNPMEELPVLDRSPYTNTTPDGLHEFGNQLFLVNGELQDGPCYILERENMKDHFRREKVSISDIENYVLNSKKFFVDRVELIEKDRKLLRDRYYKKLYLEDIKKLNKFNEYLDSFDKEKELEKK